MMTALLDPAKVLGPGARLDHMARLSGNWQHMTRFELRPFIDYVPDLDRIADGGVRIVLAAGTDSSRLDHRMCGVMA
jgi:hypothetical protein